VLAAVQLDAEVLSSDPMTPARLVVACRDHGILTRALGIGALQVSPPLVMNETELGELADGISGALNSI
jgi:adenosylmethionine-8-amino-7-oxononanoate aminotransferase